MKDQQPPSPSPVKTVLVDDQALLVSAFSLLLGSQPGLEVVGTATDGAAALVLLRQLAQAGAGADVVLMDIRMPVLDGISAIKAMRADPLLACTPVLVLTTFEEEALVLGALRAGAQGFLLKDAQPQVLVAAVREVAAGGHWLDPAVTGTVLARLGEAATAAPAGGPHDRAPAGAPAAEPGGQVVQEPLTGREQEVLALVCEGLPNAEIGERLHLAESTVKTHVKSLLVKTGCTNRVELIVLAFRSGLVPPA